MKLILCRSCSDIFSLRSEIRTCKCDKSSGRYVDPVNAEFSGPCLLLGFSNSSLVQALLDQDAHGDLSNGQGRRFEAFIIPGSAKSVKRIEVEDPKRHGGPYDRGSADRYYNRPYRPHYYADKPNNSERIESEHMTEEQIEQYALGWEEETDRKFWS